MESPLSNRTGQLDASAYALVVADLVAIAVWTWDFFASSEVRIIDADRNYFAFAWVIILLGCLGVAFLLRVKERHRRRVSMTCLRLSSSLLVLPLAGYAMIFVGASGLSNFPQ